MQKCLLEEITFPVGVKAFKNYPLWIFLDESADFSELAGKIKDVSFSGIFVKSDGVYLKGISNIQNLEVKILVFSRNLDDQEISGIENIILSKNIDCDFGLRVFRIGVAQIEGNTFFLTDSKWKKLYEKNRKQ